MYFLHFLQIVALSSEKEMEVSIRLYEKRATILSTIFPYVESFEETRKIMLDEQLVLLKDEAVFEFLPIETAAEELYVEV